MSAPTSGVLLHKASIPPQTKGALTAAQAINLAHLNSSGMDLLQIVNSSNKVVFNLSSTGIATVNPANPTTQALLGRFLGNSVAAAWSNPQNLDIYQIWDGSVCCFHLSATGAVFTP